MSQEQNPKCLNNSHSHNSHKTCIWGFGVSVVSTYSVLIHLYVVIEIIGLHRAVIPVMNNLINTICFLIVIIVFNFKLITIMCLTGLEPSIETCEILSCRRLAQLCLKHLHSSNYPWIWVLHGMFHEGDLIS